MSKKYLYLIILIILFVGYGLLNLIGWKQKTFFPMRYAPFVFLLIPFLFTKGLFEQRRFREESFLLIMFLFAVLVSFVMSRLGSVSVIFGILLSPVMLSIALQRYNNLRIKEFARYSIYSFYFIECAMSIIEKILGVNFLGRDYNIEDTIMGFRSSALHGHPLSNALLVSTIMAFILVDNRISYNTKVASFLMGFVSLLCFNTRSSIIIMSIIFLIHYTYWIFSSKRSLTAKMFYTILVYGCSSFISFLVFFTGMGGRLLERELMDNSANTRIQIVKTYLNLSPTEIIWGIGNKEILRLAEMNVNGGHAENYWVLFGASFGLLLLLPMVFLFVLLYRKYFINTGVFVTFLTSASFLIVSSTNNSLFFQASPLCVFMLCAFSMLPKYKSKKKEFTRLINRYNKTIRVQNYNTYVK